MNLHAISAPGYIMPILQIKVSRKTYRRIIGCVVGPTVALVPLHITINLTTIALAYLLVAVLVSTFYERQYRGNCCDNRDNRDVRRESGQ